MSEKNTAVAEAFPENLGALAPIPTDLVLSAITVKNQVNLIKQVMDAVMEVDVHYGVIPGTPKPTLYKPGAEKLCLTFRLDPQYDSTERYDGDHLTVKSKCTLYHIATNQRIGSGEGSCSARESKYAYRQASRKCPKCGKPAIIRGKEEYGGGWLCLSKKDGCGAKFAINAAAITTQPAGRVPNEDLPDQWNTVLKMADKRALIAAVLNATAASDIFTQDLEDMPAGSVAEEMPRQQAPKSSMEPQRASEQRSSAEPPSSGPPPQGKSDLDQVGPAELDQILNALKKTCGDWTAEEKKAIRAKLNKHVKEAFHSPTLNELMVGDVEEVVAWILSQAKS